MNQNYRSRRARGARRGRLASIAAALALLGGAASLGGACGSPSVPAPTVSDAFAAAHPTGGLPGSLRTVDLTREEVGRRVAGLVGAGVRVVLPTRLPHRFKLAAPYIAVGDGTARPNPEGWGSSYRVSYTDGRGLLVMTVGAERLPDGAAWSAERLRIGRRPARAGRVGDLFLVATVDRRTPHRHHRPARRSCTSG